MPLTNPSRVLLRTLKSFLGKDLPPFPWGVGYSGGRDSGVLLWTLVSLAGADNVKAIHVDHGWRSVAERADEAVLVDGWCGRLGVEVRHWGPPASPVHTEAGARSFRYEGYRRFLEAFPGHPIFLAHHADDQAETVLLRLFRGRSWQGLGGMKPRRGPYWRPFLGTRASVLAEAAAQLGIPFHTDTSNADPAFTRNFLRTQVMPLLRPRFPRVVESLAEFAGVWRDLTPAVLDPGWDLYPRGGGVPRTLWNGWTPVVRQNQLLAVVTRVEPEARIGRRFLETVCVDGRVKGGRGAGWSWSCDPATVRWEQTSSTLAEEYFVVPKVGQRYRVGTYTLIWSPSEPPNDPAEGLFIPAVDPEVPFVWRTPAAGMRYTSVDHPDWGKTTRRHRWGRLTKDVCAVVIQGGQVKGVVDVARNRVVWAETDREKLHKTGIFVKLRQRSDYER